MKSLLKFAVPLAALMLAGCWNSTTGLMPDKALDKAPIAGDVTSGTHSPTATRTRYSIVWKGKVATATPDGWSGDQAALYILKFDLLQKDLYLLQASDGHGAMKGYVIARFDQFKNMKTYNPPCENAETSLGNVSMDGSTCNFSDYATLLKAAKARAANIASGGGEGYVYDQYSPTASAI